MTQINVIAVGGLGGAVFSAGLKTILAKLKTAQSIDVLTYKDYTDWRDMAAQVARWRDPTAFICHSFGVTAVMAAVRAMDGKGPNIPLVVSFDPSQWWWSNLSLMFSGGNAVPDRIGRVVNFYQGSGLIGRQRLYRADGSERGISNEIITGTMHGTIEDRPDLQAKAIAEIKAIK